MAENIVEWFYEHNFVAKYILPSASTSECICDEPEDSNLTTARKKEKNKQLDSVPEE